MAGGPGIPDSIPNRYAGPNSDIIPLKIFPRIPLGTDKKYPIGQVALIGKNPSTGNEGDLWYLANFSAGVADWRLLSSSGGSVTDLRDQVNTLITPTDTGYIDINGSTVANGANPSGIPLETVGGTHLLTIQQQVAAAIGSAPGDKNDAGICSFDSADFSVDVDGFVSLTGGNANYFAANFIVDPAGLGAEYTTITTALAAASAGDTIAIKPGTYTENLTLKAGVNLTAWSGDGIASGAAAVGNVIIDGKCSATFAGNCTISGLVLQTNLDYCVEVTGANATNINLVNCFINVADNTALNISSSSSSSRIQMWYCKADTQTTGISLFNHSGAGQLRGFNCMLQNGSASTTASTVSGSSGAEFWNCFFGYPLTSSNTARFGFNNCNISQPLIANGTHASGHEIANCKITSASSSGISIGAGATANLSNCSIDSTNTNPVTGAGTVQYNPISFSNTGVVVNTTTQTTRAFGPRILLSGGCEILSGTGDPSASITAPQGSLYLRTDGSSTSTRAYINTDGSTAWTSITTAA